ncbi:metallophosphoesterase [Candidatus Uabimicrobium sp. HlEnr_7]|uniref:metallophosphoesterase n=1 Tax=Candidatus Uabimicrobium helgolandensis TaxID=3095367 RepID=UPI003556A9DA
MLKSVFTKKISSKFRKLLEEKEYNKAKTLYDKHIANILSLRDVWIHVYRKNLKVGAHQTALTIATNFENTRQWIVPAVTSLVQTALCSGEYKKAKELLMQFPAHYFSIIEILKEIKPTKNSDLKIILETIEPQPRRDKNQVLEILNAALVILQDSIYRQGFLFELPEDAELFITGDLHGNRNNFEIIKSKAKLQKHGNRHLIFQEIIHSRSFLVDYRDVSFLEVIDILELLVTFPNQVHIILGNHDLNFFLNRSSMRSKRKLDDYFFRGIELIFGGPANEIIKKYKEIITWMAAAIKCDSMILTHSNPSSHDMKNFDFERLKKISTLKPKKTIDFLVSGRDHSEETVKTFLQKCESEFSVIGHEFCRKGFSVANSQQVIIDSCHNLGTYLLCQPNKINSIEQLQACIHNLR